MYFACACFYKSRRQIQVTQTPRNSVNNSEIAVIACDVNKSEATGSCQTITSVIDEVSIVNESKDVENLNVEINQETSEEKETNKAIEMLDIVLEQEDKEDELRQNSMNQRKSFDSTPDSITVQIEIEKEIESTESKDVLDLEYLRQDIRDEIELILDQALIAIEKLDIDISEDESEDCNNVFQNQSFLNRLSSLIGVKPSPKKVTTFSTNDNSETRNDTKKQLNHSKSVPNLQSLNSIEIKDTSYHDDTIVDYNFDYEEKSDVNIPPAPVFNEELFERVATMKLKKKTPQTPTENVTKVDLIDEPKDLSDSDTETLDKAAIKLKLENIFKAPPILRSKSIKPVPLPRTSLHNGNTIINDETSPKITVKTPTSAMNKHKLMFNEVLKKIKKD